MVNLNPWTTYSAPKMAPSHRFAATSHALGFSCQNTGDRGCRRPMSFLWDHIDTNTNKINNGPHCSPLGIKAKLFPDVTRSMGLVRLPISPANFTLVWPPLTQTLTRTLSLTGGRTNAQFVGLMGSSWCNLPALGYVAMRISSFLAWKFWMFSQLLVNNEDIETPLKSKSSGRENDSIWQRVARKVLKSLEIIKLHSVRYAQDKSSVCHETSYANFN